MTTEMITVKMEDKFLKSIDKFVEKSGYQNRTEFIRNTLREKLEESELKEAMIQLSKLRGKASKKTSDKEFETIREKAFEELTKKFK